MDPTHNHIITEDYLEYVSILEQNHDPVPFLQTRSKHVQIWGEAAREGSVEASVLLAVSHMSGIFGDVNLFEGVRLCRVAANSMNPVAMYLLGRIHRETQLSHYNPEEAISYFQQSAQLGFSLAMYALALAFHNDLVNAPDHRTAVYWYEQAINNGLNCARSNLGVLLIETTSQEQDIPRGEKLLREAAELGLPEAMISLGRRYLRRSWETQDRQEARHWFEQTLRANDGELARLARKHLADLRWYSVGSRCGYLIGLLLGLAFPLWALWVAFG